ncbi:E3 ubiquitin-protein ligase RNF115-like [Liolophura sinensis]|uniref:E3 ubiquitin-protein ligase RNF115-like n=1 Tax=Liolophura sinensis TaxID=3198878 RepID=UPI0031587F7A
MAEAAVADPLPNRFYCHQCSVEINPLLPDFTCPNCENGFVEEITDDFGGSNSAEPDPAAQLAELWGRAFVESFRAHVERDENASQPYDGTPNQGSFDETFTNLHSRQPTRSRDRITGRPLFPRARVALSRTGTRGDRHPVIDNIVAHLLGSLSGGPVPTIGMFNIHGNPEDYAWGAGGLDAIITQLLNQLEGTGAPPAEKDKIDHLPTITITQEHVDKVVQCSVCMEDFIIEESVRQLPCQHCYHSGCIVPWLQLHGTCPVCRKDLSGEDTTTKDYSPPGAFPGGSEDPGSGTSGGI